MARPLDGVRILDLTHMLSGPYAGMILADLGADSIKVEPPGGEGTRRLLADDPAHSLDGMGAYFLTLNRNKKSVCIDLKHEQGRALFLQLVAHADIVLSNFAAGVPRRLGIDYDSLSRVNPRIITCTVTGFGEDGPGAHRPAFDQVAQAAGGGMSITGQDAAHPVRAGIPIGDLGGGMFGVMGVLAALYERERSGRGQHVDISMLDCQVSMLNYMATMHFLSGEDPYPIGNRHFVHVPYDTFQCADGFIVIAVITDNFWHNLKRVVKLPELDDPALDTQPGRLRERERITAALNAALAQDSCANWLHKLERERIPCAPVNRFSQALSDPQVLHREMVVELAHPAGGSTRGPGNPVKLSRSAEQRYTPAPLPGQHTDAVLSSLLGMDAAALSALREQGVIA
ncbi:MAG: acyl-CoA transferase [Halioglobus sp.]|nr:acyl-CoA transferase [Halioglobus sp.]|tara:strand:- start:1132 stop:2331 length:1200 start_codon:yes stop_codon:yes gene_type:complete